MTRWGIRVATDPSAGAGHMARCAALAEALARRPVFFTDPLCPSHAPLHKVGETIVAERDGCEATAAIAALADGEIGGLVIDSYTMSADVVADASRSGFTAAFRDGESRGPEGLAIDIGADKTDDPHTIAGIDYAPLDTSYAAAWRGAAATENHAGDPLRVLVAFGQRDSANVTSTALKAIAAVDGEISITVVAGSAAIHITDIEALVTSLPGAVLFTSPPDMVGIYMNHDLAIGAPGMSQVERACCGLPTVLVCQNSHQIPAAESWRDHECAEVSANDVSEIKAAVERLIEDHAKRAAMRQAGRALVDGSGAVRLAARLEAARVEQRTGNSW